MESNPQPMQTRPAPPPPSRPEPSDARPSSPPEPTPEEPGYGHGV